MVHKDEYNNHVFVSYAVCAMGAQRPTLVKKIKPLHYIAWICKTAPWAIDQNAQPMSPLNRPYNSKCPQPNFAKCGCELSGLDIVVMPDVLVFPEVLLISAQKLSADSKFLLQKNGCFESQKFREINFPGGASNTINEHRKDVFWWRFGENPSSRCWAVASTEKKHTERPRKCKTSPSLTASGAV